MFLNERADWAFGFRGPKSQLERQLEAIASLPRHQQQKILAVVEAMIAHQR